MNFKEWFDSEENGCTFNEAAPLEIRIQNAINYAKQIGNFYKKFKRFPSAKSPDVEEKNLGIKLNKFRQAEKGKDNRANYPEVKQAGIEAGAPEDWTEAGDLSAEANKRNAIFNAKLIGTFYKKFGRFPAKSDSIWEYKKGNRVEEKSLFFKLNNFKQAVKDKDNKKIFYPEIKQAGIDAGAPKDWLETNKDAAGLKQTAIQYAKLIGAFYKKFKKLPSKNGEILWQYKNGEEIKEKTLGSKLGGFRLAAKGQAGMKNYPEVEQIGIDAGAPKDWLQAEDRDLETLLNNNREWGRMIAAFYNQHGRLPSQQGTEVIVYKNKEMPESTLGNKFQGYKNDKINNKREIFYTAAEEAGIKAGLPVNWISNTGPSRKYINHSDMLKILANLENAKDYTLQKEVICFRNQKKCLRYDAALKSPTNDTIAAFEYQGQQHYYPTGFFGSLKEFADGVKRDENKLQLTQENNLPLLRIPYWKRNEKDTLVKQFVQDVLNAPNNKLSPSQWKHYAVDIATPDPQQQFKIDKMFCSYFNSPKGKEDAALVALYPEIKKKWKMCNSKDKTPKIQQK